MFRAGGANHVPDTFEVLFSTSAPQRTADRQEEKAGREGWRERGREEEKKEGGWNGGREMFEVTPRSIPLCFSEQMLHFQVSKYPEIILKRQV